MSPYRYQLNKAEFMSEQSSCLNGMTAMVSQCLSQRISEGGGKPLTIQTDGVFSCQMVALIFKSINVL